MLRGADVKDLTSGNVDVSRQYVPADQGVDEGALAPFSLPDHQHLVGVLPQLLAIPLKGWRRDRQLELIGSLNQLVEEGNGVLADRLDLLRYVAGLRHWLLNSVPQLRVSK